MDFGRFDRHTFIADLARAEDDATLALSRMLSPHFMYGAAWVPDWVFHHGERVRRVIVAPYRFLETGRWPTD